MNRKGAEKILSIYWFLILTVVAGGIFAMVYAFYNHPYDVRELEADIMISKMADCISEGGKIKENRLNDENFKNTFLNECGFNFDGGETMQYYLEVDFYTLNNKDESLFSLAEGNENWIADCELEKEYGRTAECVEKRFYAVGQDNNQYLIKILAIIGKTKENVKSC